MCCFNQVIMEVIRVENLIKRYKGADKNAVDGVSFSVDEGEFFAFLGPNGAGKTTTISILTTTLSKSSGKVSIAGFDIVKQSKEIREQIGVIFQKPSLDLNLTAEENIRLHASLYNLYSFKPLYSLMPNEYKHKLNELSEVLDIKEDMFKPLKTFSGGMKRKMEIIRSLMHNPRVLFLDEPTTGLDPKSRRELWRYLNRTIEENKTTVFLTTHYLDEAEDADDVCVVNNGKIVAEGSPKELKAQMIRNFIDVKGEDDTKLKKELEDKGYEYRIKGDSIRISVNPNEVHSILKRIDSRLVNIEVHTPSLEEAYLEIINKK